MLLEFSVKNYKIFKDKATISLIASNSDSTTREEENIVSIEKFGLRILKSAVIFGANASGKTKLMEAFLFWRTFIINSSKESQKGESINIEPFRLNVETIKEPTEFETIFLHKEILYRYGFELNNNKIIAEWLYYKPNTKEIELFYRDNNKVKTHGRIFVKGKKIVEEGLLRDNALLLSVAAQFNENKAIEVLEWVDGLKVVSGFNYDDYKGFTVNKTNSPQYKKKILELLKSADFGIENISLKKLDINKLPKNTPKEVREFLIKQIKEENKEIFSDILTAHKIYDINKIAVDVINFSLEIEESLGTQKFFSLVGPIIDVLEKGYTLVVDELDSQLHPNLVCKIISMFNSTEFNRKGAQLIFNTHDTNLLASKLFRRDQIWFTEKNRYGEAKLYSLADFKSSEVRKDEAYEPNYIRGKYGGVPYLNFSENLDSILADGGDDE